MEKIFIVAIHWIYLVIIVWLVILTRKMSIVVVLVQFIFFLIHRIFFTKKQRSNYNAVKRIISWLPSSFEWWDRSYWKQSYSSSVSISYCARSLNSFEKRNSFRGKGPKCIKNYKRNKDVLILNTVFLVLNIFSWFCLHYNLPNNKPGVFKPDNGGILQ